MVDMACFLPVGYVGQLTFQVLGLMLETLAKHYIPQAKNIPYQTLLLYRFC